MNPLVTVPLDELCRQIGKLAVAALDCHRQGRLTPERAVAVSQEVEEEAKATVRKLAQ